MPHFESQTKIANPASFSLYLSPKGLRVYLGRIAFFGMLACLTACAYISDGIYAQKRGYPITRTQLNELSEGKSTYEDAVRVLGVPSERKLMGDTELVTYISVRKRWSYERTMFGWKKSYETTVTDTLTLRFFDGVLDSKNEKESSTVTEHSGWPDR